MLGTIILLVYVAAMLGLVVGLGTALVLFVAWGEGGVPIAGAIAMLVPLVVMPVASVALGREKSPAPLRRPA